MQPRGYQQDAVNSILSYLENASGNPVAAMPTGTGKAGLIAFFAAQNAIIRPHHRGLILADVKELVDQNFKTLKRVWPNAPAGICSRGLKRLDTAHPILFGGIGTAAKRADAIGHRDWVFVDEAHMVSDVEASVYASFLRRLKEINPNLRTIGTSATCWRHRMGMITEGPIFDDIVYDATGVDAFNWFIDQGYLVPLIPRSTTTKIDMSGVGMIAGEYNQKQMNEVVDRDEITNSAIDEIIHYGQERKSWLIFAAGKDNALHIANALKWRGISAEAVVEGMDRTDIIRRFKNGEIRCLVNNNILTKGFDHPGIDLIAMLRPTMSAALWVQMLGRGTRPLYAPGMALDTREGRLWAVEMGGKRNCLVLDFAANSVRLGPINDPKIPEPRKGKPGTPPIRICPKCGTYNHPKVKFCIDCGTEFEFEIKIEYTASTNALIKQSGAEPTKTKKEANPNIRLERHVVGSMDYRIYRKNPTDIGRLQVTVSTTDAKTFRCWFDFGAEKPYPKKLARDFWIEARYTETAGLPVPTSGPEAVARTAELRNPRVVVVTVDPEKRYPEVKGFEYV